jgi:sugar (pentulose or hexulose) kinase
MMLGAQQAIALDRLDDALRLAPALGRELFRIVIDSGGTRLRALRQSGKAVRIDRLIEASAWTEAALALIALEMPAWKLRRLAYENGEWLCSLSRQPHLPIEIDDTVEVSHDALALAVLRALIEARRRSSAAPETISAVSEVRPTPDRMICCDNFA